MRLAFVAGPYNDDRGSYYVMQNIREAEAVAIELWRRGFAVICPHKNSAFLSGALTSQGVDEQAWYDGDLEMLSRCDLVVLTPRWRESGGAGREAARAKMLGIPVFEWPQDKEQLLESAAMRVGPAPMRFEEV